jgi:phospholipase C
MARRAAIVGIATVLIAGTLFFDAGAATAVVKVAAASGTVECTATGKVSFGGSRLKTTPALRKLKIHADLVCTRGETGNSAVTIATGAFNGVTGSSMVTCTNPSFGPGSGNIKWLSPGGTVTPSHVTWTSATITDGTNVKLDIAPPNTALTTQIVNGKEVARSYTGADFSLHVNGDNTPGGLCGAASLNFAYTGAGGSSTLTVKPPNPDGLPVNHVVVLMQENRSADDYLAQLNNQGQSDFEPQPMTGNPDPTNPGGPAILPFHKTSVCETQGDLNHSWNGTHKEVNGGAMDGFTKQNVNALDPTGSRTMGYYDQSDLPFYYGMYNTFATGDRYFSSVLSQTFPNREYLFAGTSFGHIDNSPGPFDQASVFNLLDAHSISWKIYVAQPQFGSYAGTFFKYVNERKAQHVFPMSQYFTDLANDALPAVTYIDPTQFDVPHHAENDEHPPADVEVGQKFSADIINALMASSAWSSSAFFFTYDEHGGYYDHVVPPAAPIPDNIPPMLGPGDVAAQFDQYGVRVPVAVISPFAKAHYVSHTVYDHTSILKFVEHRFGLSSLTNRDAQADPMLGMFDFQNPPFITPPTLPAATVDQAKLDACP